MFGLIQHLLPRALAWRTTVSKTLRSYLQGLAGMPSDVRDFVDLALLDLFPDDTRELPAWEREFALSGVGSEATRRLRLAAAWRALGGQSPDYIQSVLHAAGFTTVFVHEWWESSDPFVARNPRDYTTDPVVGEYQCEGSTPWECFSPGPGDPLGPHCDDSLANDPGYLVNLDLTRRPPPQVPTDPTTWPFFVYFAGESFPDRAVVLGTEAVRPSELRDVFRALVLQICPTQQWLVTMVDFAYTGEGGAELPALEASGGGVLGLPLGVTGAWYEVANASDAGSGLAFTLPDRLTSNHATTSDDARKPTLGTSANGLPILVCSAASLQVTLHAAINGATKLWVAFHARITTPTGLQSLFRTSTSKLVIRRTTDPQDEAAVFPGAPVPRFVSPALIWPTDTWVHCLLELNLGLETSPGVPAAESDRAVWCIDGVPVASTFSGGLAELPTSMTTAAGVLHMLGFGGSENWQGEIGPNIFIGSDAEPGVTSGCLTAARRTALSNYQRPTS